MAYNGLEIRFDHIGYDLSDDFVLDITQDNRPEALKSSGIPIFRYEIEVGRVYPRIHGSSRKGLGVELQEEGSKSVLIPLIHEIA